MAHNSKKVITFDRNRTAGPWQPLQPIPITPDGVAAGILAAFRNNRYSVAIKQTSSSGFLMQGPDGRAQAAPIAHLIINRLDGKVPEWKHLQRIKNELIHENAEAVEIFPGEDRRVDASQTMLWCLPPGMRFPVGLFPQSAVPKPEDEVVPGVIRRADLQFYVVETPQAEGEPPLVEVFADEQDARTCYEQNGATFDPASGALRMMGGVPHEEEGAAWSTNALVRRQELQDRIAEAGAKMAAEQAALQGRALLPNGPPTVEEELEADGAFAADGGLVDGPMEEVEAERLEQLMREGIAQKAAERREAQAKEQAVQAADEARAAAELAAMREQLRKGTDGKAGGGDPPN